MLPLTASNDNNGRETKLQVGSAKRGTLAGTFFPLFLHSIFAGLVPPFSKFFLAILDHYQIHALHLQPNSILLLSIFTFYCQAFVGVKPSVVLF